MKRQSSVAKTFLQVLGLLALAEIARRIWGGNTEAQPQRQSRLTPSTAPNNSWESGSGEAATGFDSPAYGSQWLKNPDVEGPAHLDPYYPPGGQDYHERGA